MKQSSVTAGGEGQGPLKRLCVSLLAPLNFSCCGYGSVHRGTAQGHSGLEMLRIEDTVDCI